MTEWFISYQVFDEDYEIIAFGSLIRSFSSNTSGADVLKSFDVELCKDHKCEPHQIHYVSLNRL